MTRSATRDRPGRGSWWRALAAGAIVLGIAGCKTEERKVAAPADPANVANARVVLESPAGLVWIRSAPAGIEFTKTEVTVAQFRACVEAGKCSVPRSKSDSDYCNWGYSDRDNHPLNCVDWSQATAFCGWVGGRLPTEEEWSLEASNQGKRKYAWGDTEVTCNHAVWGDGPNPDGCGRKSTWPVCSKEKGNSVSGLCDMSGNVFEWTSTREGSAWVVRGGSWDASNPANLQAANLYGGGPASWGDFYGFRCGRSAK